MWICTVSLVLCNALSIYFDLNFSTKIKNIVNFCLNFFVGLVPEIVNYDTQIGKQLQTSCNERLSSQEKTIFFGVCLLHEHELKASIFIEKPGHCHSRLLLYNHLLHCKDNTFFFISFTEHTL